MQASDGNFYGSTYDYYDSPPEPGAMFRLEPDGDFSVIHVLTHDEGTGVLAPLVDEAGGLIGTTFFGGPGLWGSIFTVDFSGDLDVVYVFRGAPDGQEPLGGLTLASDGFLYGSTAFGGDTSLGTLFRMDLAGNVVRLHSFDDTLDGHYPESA